MKLSLFALLLTIATVSNCVASEGPLVEEKFGADLAERWKLAVVPAVQDLPEPPATLEASQEGAAVINCVFRHADGIEVLNLEGIYPNYLKLENPKITSELTGNLAPGTTLSIRMKGTEERKFRVFLLTEDDRIFLIYNLETKLGPEYETFSWDLTNPENFSEIRRTTGTKHEDVDKALSFPLKTFAIEFMGFSGPTTDGAVEKIELESITLATGAK